MNLPNAEDLLRVWEESHSAHPIRRALNLLGAATPEIGGEAWHAAPIGQRDEQLLRFHESLFGPRFQTVTRCPCCDQALESSFSAGEIREQVMRPQTRKKLKLRAEGCSIEYRLPNSDDLLQVSAMVDADEAQAQLLRRCIVEAKRAGVQQRAEQLPAKVVERLADEMAKQDPAADVWIRLNCPGCGHVWNANFDIVAYIWGELEDWAQRTLADVHVLARAYGWSEREILSLSPTRRCHYIEMARA